VTGSAHVAGGKLRGGFAVKNEGATKSPALTAAIKLLGPKSKGKVPKLAIAHAEVHALAPGAKQHLAIKVALPASVKSGRWSVVVCASGCTGIGSFTATGGGRDKKKATAPNAPTVPAPPAPTPNPVCTPTTGPIAYPVEKPFHVSGCGVEYFGFVPASYNASTPMPLLIWAHGCGGEAEGDAWNVGSYGEGESYLALSLGGRDGGCWNPLAQSEQLVMAALADFEAHFNVNPHRVILSGYSSGGDLSYRTGFRHSSTFAGLLIENSAPFGETELTEGESLAAATTKFHIVHLAHEQDETYELENVESEVAAVQAAGFPLELIKRPGTHFDEPGAIVKGKAVPGTDADVRTYLLPHISDGWTSP
jgi:hypothetical protein